jgi:hypothetical protein
VLKQTGTALTPERRPNPRLSFGQSAGAAGVGFDQLGQALREGAPGAGCVAAVKSAQAQVDADRPPE